MKNVIKIFLLCSFISFSCIEIQASETGSWWSRIVQYFGYGKQKEEKELSESEIMTLINQKDHNIKQKLLTFFDNNSVEKIQPLFNKLVETEFGCNVLIDILKNDIPKSAYASYRFFKPYRKELVDKLKKLTSSYSWTINENTARVENEYFLKFIVTFALLDSDSFFYAVIFLMNASKDFFPKPV